MSEQEISAHSLSPDATAGLYDRIDNLLSEIDQICDEYQAGGTPTPPMPVLKAPVPVKPVPAQPAPPKSASPTEPPPGPLPELAPEPVDTSTEQALHEPDAVDSDVQPDAVQPDAVQPDGVQPEAGRDDPNLVDDAQDQLGDGADATEPVTPEPAAMAAPAPPVDNNQSLLDAINAELANLQTASEPEAAEPPPAPQQEPAPKPAQASAPLPTKPPPAQDAAAQNTRSSTDLDPLDASDLDDIIAELDAVDAGHGRKDPEPKLPASLANAAATALPVPADQTDDDSIDDSFDHDSLDEPQSAPAPAHAPSSSSTTAVQPPPEDQPSQPEIEQPVATGKKPAQSRPPQKQVQSKPPSLIKQLEPVAYRVGTAALNPLAGLLKDQPRVVRDTIGWLAASTVFYGIILWSYVLIFRSTSKPDQEPQGVTIVDQAKP